jgi:hypothetical protein
MKKIVMYSVEVIVPVWGTYKKGDTLKMEGTTARACAEAKVIKITTPKGEGKDMTTKTGKSKED